MEPLISRLQVNPELDTEICETVIIFENVKNGLKADGNSEYHLKSLSSIKMAPWE